ncbi:WYL domain-containing protein [Paenibacillus qinlingensis]|uniref:DNA-binding transcriptional regulator YafY n=1 Tax=Paenibacillus qinlingensis TaxID=1837343 RepID=A0ABU1NXQ7_9BACL|nr:WYL domain-containing protein [Paenibacillus qinlingensis]MDR6552288.1 putative DNA-binding transcriptional regulator YafY [Paenibacillus qinlingensis]
MNLFEKIFNYQIISRLEDSGTFMVTSHERAWLKTMLGHPAANEAFNSETLDKLRVILSQDQVMDTSDHLIEKARSREKQVYHPLLRVLRRLISERTGIRLTYEIKSGRMQSDQSGLPYKLEYSMVKREWYLLWYDFRHHTIMRTKLDKIISVTAEALKTEDADSILMKSKKALDARKGETLLEVVRDYNRELSRILYALSSFEKDVAYDTENDIYRVRVTILGDETEYLLSKVRFLGKRVRVVEGDFLKRRMLESATKALARYGVSSVDEDKEGAI